MGELQWRPPTVNRIAWILHHPIYTGAYVYGLHRQGVKNPVTGRTQGSMWFVPPDEAMVLLKDRHPAYITWERYLANQERLKQNRSLTDAKGAPKCGVALLQGIVVCGKCGRRMSVRYKTTSKPTYFCAEACRQGERESCGLITASLLDDLVVRELLRALEPATLELSLRAIDNVEQERRRLHDQWRQKLERVGHEADRVERQYNAVEPENRLVARSLETRWEEALKQRRQVEEEYHRFMIRLPVALNTSDRQRIVDLSRDVPSLWNAAETTAADRKQILRCLVERVVVMIERPTESTEATIVWKGGSTTRHRLDRPVGRYDQLQSYPKLAERLKELHRQGFQRDRIAKTLNAEGFVTARRRGGFTESGVGTLMRDLGLTGEYFDDGLLYKHEWRIPDLARELGIITQKVYYWIKNEWLHSRRTASGKHLVVWADEDEIQRLHRLAVLNQSNLRKHYPDLLIPKSCPIR